MNCPNCHNLICGHQLIKKDESDSCPICNADVTAAYAAYRRLIFNNTRQAKEWGGEDAPRDTRY